MIKALLALCGLLLLSQPASAHLLITANGPPPSGFDLYKMEDLLTSNGADLFVFTQNWSDPLVNPFPAFNRYRFNGSVYILKMIDSNIRTMPPDLKNKAFNDPDVESRFLATLHTFATSSGVAKNLNYILLGNEVDGYMIAHPDELDGFMDLIRKSVDQLHKDLPNVKVGVITTSNALNDMALFNKLTAYSDFIDYTYYPVTGGWQMRSPSDVYTDMDKMAVAATSKPFGFTEIGYSASLDSNSSSYQQAIFMFEAFQAMDRHLDQVAFVNWASLADSPDDVCRNYAKQQSVPNADGFCAYAVHTGLHTYDNQPRIAWYLLTQEIVRHRF